MDSWDDARAEWIAFTGSIGLVSLLAFPNFIIFTSLPVKSSLNDRENISGKYFHQLMDIELHGMSPSAQDDRFPLVVL